MINLTILTASEKQSMDTILEEMRNYAYSIEDRRVGTMILNYYNRLANIVDDEKEFIYDIQM